MKIGQSLYLDLFRFLMALVVIVGHASYYGYVGHGFLWQIDPFRHLQTAVMAFFVLSGFVIAYVADTKEKDGLSYVASRVARMTSIIAPALFITFLADLVGRAISPEFYAHPDFPTKIGANQGWAYMSAFLYINSIWLFDQLTPGTNGPFWSMSYEVAYYAIFGAAIFSKHSLKGVIVASVAVIAGPRIMMYLPIWLMGVGSYYLQRRVLLYSTQSAALFVISLVAAIALSTYGPEFKNAGAGTTILLYYLLGFCFAVNIFASGGIEIFLASSLSKIKGTVRWLGMMTFSMYLVHRPLLNLFSVIKIGEPNTLQQRIWLFGLTFLVIIAVAYFGEWLRVLIRDKLKAIRSARSAEEAVG